MKIETPQYRYSKAQRKDGMARVTLWVPADKRARLLKFAAKLRSEAA